MQDKKRFESANVANDCNLSFCILYLILRGVMYIKTVDNLPLIDLPSYQIRWHKSKKTVLKPIRWFVSAANLDHVTKTHAILKFKILKKAIFSKFFG